ncbi:hypothetical protein ACFL3G_13615, partial [Planctomycetota bacterium]
MSKHMLLSIFRHRPSARDAPQQSPILLIDNYDSTFTVTEVKHFYLPILYRFVDTLQQAIRHSLEHFKFVCSYNHMIQTIL